MRSFHLDNRNIDRRNDANTAEFTRTGQTPANRVSVPADDCRRRWLELGVGWFTRSDGGGAVRTQPALFGERGLKRCSVRWACQIAPV
jgi:hypothetical protein